MSLKRIAIGAAVLCLAALAAIPLLRPQCTNLTGANLLTISIAQLGRGETRLFCYDDHAGEKLRFLLARGNDGKIRSVFDACRQCFKFHQGYAAKSGTVICRLCGNHYPIDHMTKGEASCVPVSLPHQQSGSNVQIRVSDLESGGALF